MTELLDQAASDWPEKEALVEGDRVVSYSGLVAETELLAAQFRENHIAAGCRVGLGCPNSIAYVALTFALWRVDAVVVPIPTECTPEECSLIVATMQLGAVISWKPQSGSVLLQSGISLTRVVPEPRADNHGLHLAFIRFTSGTTSARKGVALSHESVAARIDAANRGLGIGPGDTVMWCLPMSHHFLVTIALYLSKAARIILARHVLSHPFLEAANRWGATVLYAAPFHYSLLARDTSGQPLASVRLAVSTTCSLTRETSAAFQERFGLPLSQALGVIELGLVCVNGDAPAERWESVGRPLPGYAIRIRHPDADGCGEVTVSGPGFFDAYVNPWTPRDQVMTDGAFPTGDVGRLDETGRLFLVGRKAAVINMGGRKVFPEEVESVLNSHPSVRESRAFGIPHPHLGELVEAQVVLRQAVTTEALRDYCGTRLSPHKIPSRFQPVDLIERTAVTGKILRHARPASHE